SEATLRHSRLGGRNGSGATQAGAILFEWISVPKLTAMGIGTIMVTRLRFFAPQSPTPPNLGSRPPTRRLTASVPHRGRSMPMFRHRNECRNIAQRKRDRPEVLLSLGDNWRSRCLAVRGRLYVWGFAIAPSPSRCATPVFAAS